MKRRALTVAMGGLLMVVAACGGAADEEGGAGAATSTPAGAAGVATTPPTTTTKPATSSVPASRDDECAHVVGVEVTPGSDGFTFSVTVASADTGWEKYADAWVVKAEDGTVLAERILTHPHVDEQPFTRSLGGIQIAEGVTSVGVAARDSVLGFCGQEMTVTLGAAGS